MLLLDGHGDVFLEVSLHYFNVTSRRLYFLANVVVIEASLVVEYGCHKIQILLARMLEQPYRRRQHVLEVSLVSAANEQTNADGSRFPYKLLRHGEYFELFHEILLHLTQSRQLHNQRTLVVL